jgi:tetratricopeptide (TPR) repeat protein
VNIGMTEVALGYFERVLAAGSAEGDRRLEAAGLGHLGNAYLELGDAQRAIEYHEQALIVDREIGIGVVRVAPSRAWGMPMLTWGTRGGPLGSTGRR